jgi:hypothetical protein
MYSLEGEAAPSRLRPVRNTLANGITAGASRVVVGLLSALLLFLAPAFSFADAGDSWTNRVGHALKATPKALRNGSVTFVQDRTGKSVEYPLSAFLPSEQERLRCCLKDLTLPEGLKAGHEFAVRVIARSRLLQANGSLSQEECQKAQETAVSAFRAQAAPFIARKQLSHERLELIARELVAPK